jgi:hypothetical protein
VDARLSSGGLVIRGRCGLSRSAPFFKSRGEAPGCADDKTLADFRRYEAALFADFRGEARLLTELLAPGDSRHEFLECGANAVAAALPGLGRSSETFRFTAWATARHNSDLTGQLLKLQIS